MGKVLSEFVVARWTVQIQNEITFQFAPFCCCPSEFTDDVNPVTKEKGGPRGPEPTRYGDWERKGRCVDF